MQTTVDVYGHVTHSYKWGKRQVKARWGKIYKSESQAIKSITDIKDFISKNQLTEEILDCNFIYTLYEKDGEIKIPISKRILSILKKENHL